MLIPGYPKGSDITILETIYHRPRKMEDGKYSKDVLTVIFKDNERHIKNHYDIIEPEFSFYMVNDDVILDNYNYLFIEKEKVHPVTCKYRDLEKTIAELTGNLDFYYDNLKSGNYSANKFLFTDNRIFSADIHLEDYYRKIFAETYTNSVPPGSIAKGFIDIEVDVKDMPQEDKITEHMGDYPITAVTYINEATKEVYTFSFKDKRNPLSIEFETYVRSIDYNEMVKEFVKEKLGGWKNEIRFDMTDMKYKIFFYDDEIELLYNLFQVINKLIPDFVVAWNAAFDIPYIISRIIKLGFNPVEILCHKDFKYKRCEYFIDQRHINEFAEKGDCAKISCYTVYLDQLQHYASRRKGQALPPNFRLDTIGEIVAKVRKYDYSHITNNIEDLPYLDYKTYILYNIMDTIVQKCVEFRVEDINYLFMKCLMNNNRYDKGHRNTIYLHNRGVKEFLEEEGLIMGNNVNKFKDKPTGKFPGAIVGDPTLVMDKYLMKANGVPTRLFENGDDYDYSAMYPNLTTEFNICPTSMIGKLEIPNQINKNENQYNGTFFIREGAFLDDLKSHNFIDFCSRWFNYGTFEELLNDIIEYYTKYKLSTRSIHWGRDTIEIFREIPKGSKIPVFIELDKDETLQPIILDYKYQDYKKGVLR